MKGMSNMKCPTCRKENTFRAWEGPDQRMGVDFVARGQRCSNCGETLFDFEEIGRQDKIVALGIAKRGIRDAKELKFVRKTIDIKALDLGELLDVAAETVSRWENEKLPIPRYAVFILGELAQHPKATRE